MFRKFNYALASKITLLISTMECVYLFMLWSLIPLAFPAATAFMFYVSGGILQLILLPLIMVGQSVLNKHSEQRAEEDHDTLMAELAEMKAMHEETHDLLADYATLVANQEKIINLLTIV